MNQPYELCVIDKEVREKLAKSPNFNTKIIINACSEEDARNQAYNQYPMCDSYAIKPANNVPDYPKVLAKYPNLWLDASLTSCSTMKLNK